MPDVLPAASNPFIHARALHPEAERLLKLVAGGHSAVLHAPRRMGKTTLVKAVLQGALEREMPGILIDLSGVLSVTDLAARLEQAYRGLPKSLREVIGRELATIGFLTPFGGANVGRHDPSPDPIARVHALLDLPARAAARRGRRVLVVIDEFQALFSLEGMDGAFRSHIQHQIDVSYIFAGSEPSTMRALFEDRSRPLYGQAERLRLGRLPSEASYDFIVARFHDTNRTIEPDLAAELIRLGEGHAQRLMLIAHLLWDRTEVKRAVTLSELRGACSAAMRAVDQELRYLWESLKANERRVLAALASGISPYGQEARALMGLANSSSAARSVEQLERRAVIERVEETEDLRIVDPLFSHWIRLSGGARTQVYVFPYEDGFAVTEGASLAFLHSQHPSLSEAEADADAIASGARGAEVMIIDSDDPNDLPDWALASRVTD
jgi:AAA+ ATPase superfamily predicted ATPase